MYSSSTQLRALLGRWPLPCSGGEGELSSGGSSSRSNQLSSP